MGIREDALKAGVVGRKTHPGWFDHYREADAEGYRELFELVRDFEAGDAELRQKFVTRTNLWRSFVEPHLVERSISIGRTAFEDYARRVNGGDRHVEP